MVVQYHLDENVNHAIAVGLRQRGIDVTTATGVDLLGAADSMHLTYAHTERRVLVTHDDDFLRLAKTNPHHGIAYCPPGRRSIGDIVRALTRIWRDATTESMAGLVTYL